MEKIRCRYCNFCKNIGRTQETANSRNGYSRKEYVCDNPKAKELPMAAFGKKAPCFIGFGESSRESKLQLKTTPRWCPRRTED